MEMHQIRYFLTVCKTLNFTHAAAACNVTQPALTRAVQKLEEEMGGLLLRRERSRTHLTELGQTMRPYLEKILRNTEAAGSTAKSFLTLEAAALRLGVMCTVGPRRCVRLMAQFHHEHPGVSVTLHEGVPAALGEMLEQDALDLAIMAAPGGFGERFHIKPLYRERFVVAFPPGHRFNRQDTVRTIDCGGESYLMRMNCEYASYWDGFLEEHEVELKEVYRSEREDWIQSMVMAGAGICFLPEYSSLLLGLGTRPLVEPAVYREVALVTMPGRRFSPAMAAFSKTVTRYSWPISKHPPSKQDALHEGGFCSCGRVHCCEAVV
jgi:DNA-binding transcriptional LysR family regulator